ncbi:MAG: S-methyl-5-thioribose-1-phosphate isomerase [Deltaproteobacteria bacterium]|nr:MAG: S-methyl-5-thioribose-1-phosphate isomerase [Deltaproteobacteria bacterium]TMA77423.1 MAG: S-methyl-5-thioribose-1-phosphate isomerase [Deltaproteobacteria bacterium]TMB38106.1 MAG: S-methyl-5-thioribose-1-phosphate isomerase [Deltaproteobacteria bacterium]
MSFRTLWFEDGTLHLLDQRRLPAQVEIVQARTARETAQAIREMIVRGAPAIGCAAAYGLALAVRSGENFAEARSALLDSRPTAVNLRWAVERLSAVQPRTFEALRAEADRVLAEDLAACRAIGRQGAALVPDGRGILTHCNAGGLATAGYGTALGVVRAALEAGKKCAVFADETRPWLQGARLTAWELLQDGIPVTLLPDAAAASLLSSGRIGCVVVGADRIACNGDTANKVGTYPLALAADAAQVPFFVAAPTSTVDLRASSGREIPIEERAPSEVTHLAGSRVAAEGVHVFNPAFDVTPSRYITAIVTEWGVARPPYERTLAALVRRENPPEGR